MLVFVATVSVASTPSNKPPADPTAVAIAVPESEGRLAYELIVRLCALMDWAEPLPTYALTVAFTIAVDLETPTDTPVLTEKPRALAIALGSAVAVIAMSSAVTLDEITYASTTGATVAMATEVAFTSAMAVVVLLASTVRSPLRVKVLFST